jgi:hypothetical protein
LYGHLRIRAFIKVDIVGLDCINRALHIYFQSARLNARTMMHALFFQFEKKSLASLFVSKNDVSFRSCNQFVYLRIWLFCITHGPQGKLGKDEENGLPHNKVANNVEDLGPGHAALLPRIRVEQLAQLNLPDDDKK